MRAFVRDTSLVAAAGAVSTALALALQVILARTLSPGAFGELLVAQAAITLVEVIIISRAGEVALYLIGRHWDESHIARAYAAFLRRQEARWSLLVFAGLLCAAVPLSNLMRVDPLLVIILAMAIPVQSGFGVSKAVFVVSGRLVEQALLEITLSSAGFLAAVGALLLYGPYGFVSAVVATAGLKTLAAAYLSSRYWLGPAGSVHVAAPASMGLSAYAIARNVSASIASQIDVLVLGMLGAKETVAVYKVARTLAGLPTRIAAPVWSALRPRVLDAMRRNDERRFRRLLVLPAAGLGVFGLCVAPLLWWFSDGLIALMYGEDYRAAAVPFVILLAGTWCYSGITGWLSFVAIISGEKAKSTILYVVLATATTVGAVLAGSSGVRMAAYVAGAMIVTSMVAWYMLKRSYFNIK